MKKIIQSVLTMAILALVVTGCQKESDNMNVSLKGQIAFDGGWYESEWTSGNAEAECALAGGCDGGSYKIDSGVDLGVYFNEGGVTVTGINKQKFSWTSIYPVCKIIVKAGRGAYIFEIGGTLSGTVPYPANLGIKEKDISHITFCFAKPKPYIIAVKSWYNNWSDYALSYGDNVFQAGWCGNEFLGVNSYPTTTSFIMRYPFTNEPAIGLVTVGNGEIKVDLYGDRIPNATFVYVGTLYDLQNSNLNSDGCPYYGNGLVWMSNTTTAINTAPGVYTHTFPMP